MIMEMWSSSFIYLVLSIVCVFLVQSNCEYIPKWSCNFENGFCHWLQVTDDNADFKNIKGSEILWKDHTKNSYDGKFLYFSKMTYSSHKDAKLMSPILMPSNGSCKMIIHYKVVPLYDLDNVKLFVSMVTKNKDMAGIIQHKLLYQSKYATSWTRKDITLKSDVEFQVEIRASVMDTFSYGEIGLDDILFSEDCYTNEKSSIKLVKLWSSPDHNYPAGVFYQYQNDSWSPVCNVAAAHTACRLLGLQNVMVGTPTVGHLASGESFCLPSNATVPTPKVCSNTSACSNVTFWQCQEDYISMCPKLTHQQCTSSIDWPVCVSYDEICDFVKNCPGGEDESNCFAYNRCDFQNNFCDWIPSKNTIFEWERYYEDGRYYLRVDNSHAHRKTDSAILKLRYKIQGTSNTSCRLRFSYRIVGNYGSELQVIMKENRTFTTLWTLSSFSNRWSRANLQLPYNKTFQILFNATSIRYGGKGEFNLANVSFSNDCQFTNHIYGSSHNASTSFLCHSGEIIDKSLLCDFKPDCFDGSDELNCSHFEGRCDFDSSLCDWKQGENAPQNMILWRGGTPSRSTGPSKDHTNKFISGQYVYLEASIVQSGSFAYLESKTMQRSFTNTCTFRWFYHMYTDYEYDMGRLSIIYKDVSSQSERILWTFKGNQGDIWKFGSVTFHMTSFLYKIFIKAERGDSYQSDIAIDDVSFAPECFHIQEFQPLTISNGMYNPDGHMVSISSPDYATLHWEVTARTDPKLRISLFAEYLNTGRNGRVRIDAGNDRTGYFGGSYWGSFKPFSLISSGNNLTIRYFNWDMNDKPAFGFNITSTDMPAHKPTYHQISGEKRIDLIRRCGYSIYRETFFSSGTIYPRMRFSSYLNNERCIFKIFSYNGYRISLHFRAFETERMHDYLQFLNNGTIGHARYTGSLAPFSLVSKRSHVEFLFYTNGSVTQTGFILDVKPTTDVASGTSFAMTTTQHPVWTTSGYTMRTTPYYSRNTGRYPTTTENFENNPHHSKKDEMEKAIVILSSSFAIFVVGITMFWIYKRLKVKQRRIRENGYTSTNTAARNNLNRSAENHRPEDLVVRYVNLGFTGETLPTYDEATKGQIFTFYNSQQNPMRVSFADPPPPFDAAYDFERPPAYNPICDVSQTQFNASVGDGELDLAVSLPDIEVPNRDHRPHSRDGRPSSRTGSRSISTTSLRNPINVSPFVAAPEQSTEQRGVGRNERGTVRADQEIPREESRHTSGNGSNSRQHSNASVRLPPIERVRAINPSAPM